MTRDPDVIAAELANLAALDTEQRAHIDRTRRTIAGKRAEMETLTYHVDILLCLMERRHMAMDGLLDELLAAKEGVRA